MSYNLQILNAKDDLTLSKKEAFRLAAIDAGVARALKLKIAGSAEELDVRPFSNILDIPAIVLDQWNTAALLVVGNDYSVFQAVAAPTLAPNKLAVFYKVGIETVPVPVCQLIFRTGGALGSIMRQYDLEQIINSDTLEGYFSEPTVIEPARLFAIQVRCRIATLVFARVQLGGYVVEPKGQVVQS